MCAQTQNPIPDLDPMALLQLPQQRPRASKVRVGISGNLGAHTRELCAGVAVAMQQWIETSDQPYGVELLWAEDSFDEGVTRRAAKHLIEAGSLAVVGHLASSSALPASHTYYQAHLPYIAPGTSHPRLTAQGYWNTLRVCGRDDELAEMFARLVSLLATRRVTLVWQDITYGRTLAKLIRRAMIERGQVIDAAFAMGEDLNAQHAEAVMQTDALLYAGTYQAGIKLLGQLRSIGYPGAIVMGDDAYLPDFPLQAGTWAEDVYVISTQVDPAHADFEPFHRAYVTLANFEPGAYAATSYVAMKLVLQALDVFIQAGPVAGLSRVRTLAAMEPSLLGAMCFTTSGDLRRFPWGYYRIKAGRYLPYSLNMEEL